MKSTRGLVNFNGHPRDHFSWSQFKLFRSNPVEYVSKYITNPEGSYTNAAMQLGKNVHEMLEYQSEEVQDDAVKEHLRIFLPKYKKREYEIDGVNFCGIPLVGILDGFDPLPDIRVGEYKTGRYWTQEIADNPNPDIGLGYGGQITWYALLLHLKYGIRPEDIPFTVHWMPTTWEESIYNIKLTGEIQDFKTRRTMRDCLDLGKKIVDTWNAMPEWCEPQLKALGVEPTKV